MEVLESKIIVANTAGLAFSLTGAGTAFGRGGTVPWMLVLTVLVFLFGIVCWAAAKTSIGWWKSKAHENAHNSNLVFIGFDKPMERILLQGESWACILGIVLGVIFLVSIAA